MRIQEEILQMLLLFFAVYPQNKHTPRLKTGLNCIIVICVCSLSAFLIPSAISSAFYRKKTQKHLLADLVLVSLSLEN